MSVLTTNQPIKISIHSFSTHEEYRATYIEIWEKLHPTLVVDEDWILRDWNQRVKDQNAK
jgi:hypothetical protein